MTNEVSIAQPQRSVAGNITGSSVPVSTHDFENASIKFLGRLGNVHSRT